VPYAGADATGLGKPLRSILHGRADIPFYLAAIGPKNVALAAEIADGWLPIFYSPERAPKVYGESIRAGLAKGKRTAADFDIAVSTTVIVTDDVQAGLGFVKPMLALYIGGMGARGKNFYNDLACRYGFEAEAKKIQDLYLDGKKDEATALVPDALADEVALVGPKERIRDRLARWRSSPVGTMIVATMQQEALGILADAAG